MDIPQRSSYVVVGAGIHGLSTAFHLAKELETRGLGSGTDVVVLDARTGTELLRVTNDGRSWSPTWSPRGDAIAFLHVERQIVDLRMVELDGVAPNWRLGPVLDLTKVSGLDGASRPDWFIPPAELPPSPPPSVAPSGGSGEPAGSPSPGASTG